jgi:hypothetical protein
VLLLFAPPGSAKSTYVSVLLPSWYLANHPENSILAATHNVEFAERWGRRVRNDIATDANVLGISLSEDSKAAARWSLTSGGEYYGVGAGVGISGFRANLGVGDDLFGSREDAYSDTVREKRWNWYVDDFSARLKPGAKRILMNTRWHEEDVAGRVLEQIGYLRLHFGGMFAHAPRQRDAGPPTRVASFCRLFLVTSSPRVVNRGQKIDGCPMVVLVGCGDCCFNLYGGAATVD